MTDLPAYAAANQADERHPEEGGKVFQEAQRADSSACRR